MGSQDGAAAWEGRNAVDVPDATELAWIVTESARSGARDRAAFLANPFPPPRPADV